MEREIERIYAILQELRLAKNNIDHSFDDLDLAAIKKSIIYLEEFYDAMSDSYKKAIEKKDEKL